MTTLQTEKPKWPDLPVQAPERSARTVAAPPAASDRDVLTKDLLAPAVVVVLGAITTILDATIVNVALPTLGHDLHTSISTIQWVPTIYLLAFASVIPLSGWAAGRFGPKRVWIGSLGVFMTGSLLAGLSPTVGVLIASRVIQGLGGGMIMPLGQAMLAQVAGPKRLGRVMSIVGVPMLLIPIFGPLIGGSLIEAASWRWIFFVNLPTGLLAIACAIRLLPKSASRPGQRLDLSGVVLLSGGLALCLYGLAQTSQRANPVTPGALGPIVAGAVLIGLFVRHALWVSNPLIDVRLFRQRGFATGAAVNLVLGTALFGSRSSCPCTSSSYEAVAPSTPGCYLRPRASGRLCPSAWPGI
jgi:EmrB/QacA subfamily drug resistance transporter